MTGAQAERLARAMAAICRDRGRLARLLMYRANRSLDAIIAAPAGLTESIDAVILDAQAGWLTELVQALLQAQAHPDLVTLAGELEIPTVPVDPSFWTWSSSQPLPDSPDWTDATRFDLSTIDESLKRAVAPRPGIRRALRGFGVRYAEEPFVNYLCERLKRRLGSARTDIQAPFTLSQQISSIKKPLAEIAFWKRRGLFAVKHVVCVVQAEFADDSTLSGFWEAVSNELGNVPNSLALVITGATNTTFPADVVELPAPAFDFVDLHSWAVEAVTTLQWKPELAECWAQQLFEACLDEETSAPVVSRVYHVLFKETVNRLRADALAVRNELEARS